MYLKSIYIWILGFCGFCRNRTDNLGIDSPALKPTELVLNRLNVVLRNVISRVRVMVVLQTLF